MRVNAGLRLLVYLFCICSAINYGGCSKRVSRSSNRPFEPVLLNESEDFIYGFGVGTSSRMNISVDRSSQSAETALMIQVESFVSEVQNEFNQQYSVLLGSELNTYFSSCFEASKHKLYEVNTEKIFTSETKQDNTTVFHTFIILSITKNSIVQSILQALKNDPDHYSAYYDTDAMKWLLVRLEKGF